jgi:hypothetical protein
LPAKRFAVLFRRYCAWLRIRGAIEEIVRGSRFRAAAHAAGFAEPGILYE